MVKVPFQFEFVLTEIVTEGIPKFVCLRVFAESFGSHNFRKAFAIFRKAQEEAHRHRLHTDWKTGVFCGNRPDSAAIPGMSFSISA